MTQPASRRSRLFWSGVYFNIDRLANKHSNAILPHMNKANTHEGVIMVRGKGTGFVNLPDINEDIVIERESLGFALDGDIVEIELKKKYRENVKKVKF